MDYFLTEEQLMIKDLARQITEEKIVPVRAELECARQPSQHPRGAGPGAAQAVGAAGGVVGLRAHRGRSRVLPGESRGHKAPSPDLREG